MSLDRSLKSKASLARHRNVLSRAERIARLRGEERWQEEEGVLGLPKVGNIKPKAGKKKVKEEAAGEGAAATPGAPAATAATPAAAAAKPAPGGKPAPAAKPAGKDDKKK